MLDVLVVAPHPDDAELGMAGTILCMKDEGLRVGILELTSGEPTPYGSLPLRQRETAAATGILGIDWRDNLGLPNRSLEHTLEARRQLAGVFRTVRPRWIFAPYWEDSHPDHVAATSLVEAARFWSKLTKSDLTGEPFFPERIYYYFCIHLRLAIEPSFLVDISDYWPRKQQAIECYQSQFFTGRDLSQGSITDRLREQAAAWGWAAGTRYAEPFATREPVTLKGLSQLL